MDDQPFDQTLFDAVMDYDLEGEPRPQIRHPYDEGYRDAALAAERQPVSDEELDTRKSAYEFADELATILSTIDFTHQGDLEMMIADIMEASATLTPGPAVPVIPEGWRLTHIFEAHGGKEAIARLVSSDNRQSVKGTGDNWLDALTAAIEMAKERDRD